MDNKKVRKKKVSVSEKKISKRKDKQMRPVPTIRIFGYGSLLNEENVQSRLSGKTFTMQPGKLTGYQRTFSKWGRGHVYLTLRRMMGNVEVEGVLIDVDPIGFAILTRYEPGYELVEVTTLMLDYPSDSPRVYCYIGESLKEIPPEIAKIRRSYLDKCLGGVASEKHSQWLEETHIPKGVVIAEED